MQGRRGPWCLLVCEHCGSDFRRKRWQLRTSGRFCSKKCSGEAMVGEAHAHWRGGVTISQHGYRQVRVDGRYEWEHRVVAARTLGRSLLDEEHVHHRNGDRLDNDPANLVVLSATDHMAVHAKDPKWRAKTPRLPNPKNRAAMLARWADPSARAAMTAAIRRGKGLTPLAETR